MIRARLITSRYGSPERIRRWQFTFSGDVRCLSDAPLTSSVSSADRERLDAATASVRAGVEKAEAYEAARRVPEPAAEVPRTQPVYDEAGTQTGTVATPAWVAYDAAQALLSAATDDLVKFVRVRDGEPEKWTDETQTQETADWQAWSVANTRFREAVPSLLEDAPLLTSVNALSPSSAPPDFG